ncbi:nucleotidyltransferase family protein [bacterium]|nr:nucleotidyltransferase family protein [bacterium]
MLTQADILREIEKHRETLKRFGVMKLGIFGSGARGETDSDSDLDFIVELGKKTFDDYMDTKEFLEGLFNRPVDLVLSDAIKPALRKKILEETVYAKGL